MKRLGWVLIPLLIFSGCTGKNRELDRAMELRTDLLSARGCSFSAEITADYGDSLNQFSVDCTGDSQGSLTFCVTAPETIAGITGTLSAEGGRLTFDDRALAFDYLTDDQLTPVSAPWIFLRTLRSGYLRAAGREGEQIHILAEDSYEEGALTLDIWLEAGDIPIRAEILYRGHRILTLEIENFRILTDHG